MGAQAVKPIQSSEPDDLSCRETECHELVKEPELIVVIIIKKVPELYC